jgi:HrpA-like RNA helicase
VFNDQLNVKFAVESRYSYTFLLLGFINSCVIYPEYKPSQSWILISLFLQIIVMSATMDVDHFSKYFNKAPVFYIEGRQHKVDVSSEPHRSCVAK